ncbi:uncharacterized protein Tco025E_09305, partial [Trypanosoma conorhini]
LFLFFPFHACRGSLWWAPGGERSAEGAAQPAAWQRHAKRDRRAWGEAEGRRQKAMREWRAARKWKKKEACVWVGLTERRGGRKVAEAAALPAGTVPPLSPRLSRLGQMCRRLNGARNGSGVRHDD